MDSEDSEEEVEYTGMLQPPLTKMLKSILAEYPDDGQILKELIQNAEDAEASEVKLLLDTRDINSQEVNSKKRPFYKYFQGPAMFFYNNAEFTEKDWEGIRMLYSSVKELDPFKVGRFGLGFKSVFHITDYPMIVSNDKLLIIDPHKTDTGKVCQTIRLRSLPKCKRLSEDEYRSALFGIFGFSEETIRSGRFNGTLFRFPLRKTPTELSDNLYNAKRVTGMLKSFKEEASLTLLFLKFLHSIDLYVNHTKHSIHCTIQPLYSVQMSRTSSEKVMQNRLKFSRAIQQNSQQSLTDINDVTICSQALDKQGTVILEETKTWVVINVFKGSGISQTLRNLSNDKSLSYSPCVGIAAPMTVERGFKGHVFCFLPLPLEPRSLTGLPVHVNGYFALSQNRRHVKWPSADQTGEHGHLDKAMQWNQCLVQEVLSQTYVHLIEHLVSKCKEENNPKDMVSMVYRVIPSVDESIDDRWRIMVRPFLDSILQRDILFTEYNGGTWLKPVDAVFGRFDPGIDDDVQDTVKRIARKYKQKLVEVPDHIWQLVRQNVPNHLYLSADLVTRLLKSSPSYTTCSSTDKQNLVKFLVENDEFSNLQDLELLPLASGTFTSFHDQRSGFNPIFYCSENESVVCQAYTNRIVKIELQPGVRSILKRIAETGMFQLEAMHETDIVSFIGKTCDTNFEQKDLYMEWDPSKSKIKADWIKFVWRYIADRSLSSFQKLSIVPQSTGRLVLMYKLSDTILLSENQLPDQLVRAFKYFPILVLQNIPKVMEPVNNQSLKQYMHPPTSESVCQVFVEIYRRKDITKFIKYFNNKASIDERLIFSNYIKPKHILIANTCLKNMDIFKVFRQENFTSVGQVQSVAANEKFPLRLPSALISPEQNHLATRLGAQQVTEHDMMLMALQEGRYNEKETKTIMSYLLSNIDFYKSTSGVMNLARDVCFVATSSGQLKRASDLWNPSKLLKVLLNKDQTKFPDPHYESDNFLYALRILGLNDENNITPHMIYKLALDIDRGNKETGFNQTRKEKSECIILLLSQRCSLLDECVERRTLKDCLKDLCFLPSKKKPQLYPDVVPWFGRQYVLYSPREMLHGSAGNQRLVGTSMPLVTTLPDVFMKSFNLLRNPSVEKVLEQLLKLSEIYRDQIKPDILPFLKDIYEFLSNCTSFPNNIQEYKCVWVGNGFEMPHKVFLKNNHISITAEPYMFLLPREFHTFYTFFLDIGCVECQTDDTLIDVLDAVNKNHNSNVRTAEEKDRDLNLVIQILNYLKNTDYDGTKEILFPVHTSNSSLKLRPAKECHYSNADWLKEITEEDDDDDVIFVHADIPGDTAEKLGVLSLTESLFGDAEGMEEWGQTEPLTRRIKCILREYKDGFSVPKEIVQNADDAGATEVYFLYDERENDTPDFRSRLIDEQMSECQGPALWAYNNAEFTKEDLSNITKLSGATKENDASKIGKFGLGFCSVYNLTDVPSFVSGSDVVIFDPHYKYLGKAIKNRQPGVKINMKSLKNKTLLRRMKNQFKPFKDVFGCHLGDTNDRFNGTLFRFPLRTTQQARESEISDVAYSRKEMEELISIFLKGCANILLFSQNVIEIRFYHLSIDDTNPQNPKLISSVQRNVSSLIPQHLRKDYSQHPGISILRETFIALQQNKGKNIKKASNVSNSRKCIFTIKYIVTNEATKMLPKVLTQTTCTDWFIAWATGTNESLKLALQTSVKGAVHLAGVAIPVAINGQEILFKSLAEVPFGFYKESHLFCFLPLPYTSSLPVHVNAAFSVSSDRRRLLTKMDDDKNSFEGQWNNALMCDAIPNAYIFLLQSLQNFIVSEYSSVWNLWPSITNATDEGLVLMLCNFYRKIVSETENRRVITSLDTWVRFADCEFLDNSLVRSDIGDIAMEATLHLRRKKKKTVMKIPTSIETAFKDNGFADRLQEKTITIDAFFSEIFFPNITSICLSPKDRNQIVIFALKNLKSVKCLEKLLKKTACIPTSPAGRLRKPSDVIHPHSSLKDLFTDDDERFVLESFANDYQCLLALERLGMIRDILSNDMVGDRAKSVNKMKCSNCCLKRSCSLMQYFSNFKNKEKVVKQMQEIRCIPFLSVMEKIPDWPFTWKADNTEFVINTLCEECKTLKNVTTPRTRLSAPKNTVHSKHALLVGSEQLLLQDYYLEPTVLTKLGVAMDINVETVYRQMINICKQVNPRDLETNKKNMLTNIFNESYAFLDNEVRRLQFTSSNLDVSKMHKFPVFLFGEHFILSSQLARNLKYDCSPHLFGIGSCSMLKSRHNLLTALDIKDHIPVEIIVLKVIENQKNIAGRPLEQDELEVLKLLLELLTETMQKNNVSFQQLHKTVEESYETEIMLPDLGGTLCQLSKLCINDSTLDVKEPPSNVVHDIISHQVAKSLGVITMKRQSLHSHIKTRSFGQREDLTKRIQRILEGYPRDDGIFKELIQNADDAGASEIHFVTDFKNHPTDKLFNEEWKSLQGPALLVFNDSEFTENDLEGIQQLGTGSKGSDPTKTGQFGVGFNVVYHLTDVPSFITKGPNVAETLCVMDPNRRYVDSKYKHDTGVQYCDLRDLRGEYEDVFVAYHENVLLQDKGTILRFPLRTSDMAKASNISEHVIDENSIQILLKEFKKSAFECVLFLKNLRKITISDISRNDLKTIYEVSSSFSKDGDIAVSEYLRDVNSLKDILQLREISTPKEVQYVITVSDNEKRTESFLVVQRCGCENDIDSSITEAFKNNNLNLLPLGGIAVPVELGEQKEMLPCVVKKHTNQGYQAFCFLPLPVYTGLPFHVNGHFELDHEAKRALWQDVKQDYKSLWNKTILEHVIAPCFSSIMLAFKQSIETYLIANESCSRSQFESALCRHHSVFPDYSSAKDDNWKTLVSGIYRAVLRAELAIFPSLLPSSPDKKESQKEHQKLLFKFIPIKRESELFESVSTSGCSKHLVEVVRNIGLRVLDSPECILNSIRHAGFTIQHLTPKYLARFLKSHGMAEEVYKFNIQLTGKKVDIRKTHIEKPEHFMELYRYCARSEHFEEEIDGLPLCVTQDSQLQIFKKNEKHFCTQFVDILPQSAADFLHTSFVREILLPKQVIQPFTLGDFIRLLSKTLDYDKFYSSKYFTSSNEQPGKEWIKEVWRFIDNEGSSQEKGRLNRQYIKNNLKGQLGSWCLLPCKRKKIQSHELEEILLPVHCIDEVLDTSSFTGVTKRAFKRLNFPFLNDECLPSDTILDKVIAGNKNPYDVLYCLYCHRSYIAKIPFSVADCDTVMMYISNNLQTILKDLPDDEKQRVVDRIKSLPLHVTVYGETTRLDNSCDVLVLPAGMPDAGVASWASESRTTLLRQNDNLQCVHDLLWCSVSSHFEVYSCHILPNIDFLPCQDYVHHMQFIRTNLLRSCGGEYDDEQKKLIEILRDTPFIGENRRKASWFYSKQIPLFEMMCKECEFLPEPYCNQEWQTFMELIGLKSTIPNDLFIKFANSVASDGMKNDMTDSTIKRAEQLFQELLTRVDTSDDEFLETVSTIRFVLPHHASKLHNDIFPQYGKGSLIPFAHSISSQFEDLAWTTCHIFPSLKINVRMLPSKLGFQDKPSLEQVIQNLHNVSSSLKQIMEQSKDTLSSKTVIDILSIMFRFLEENATDDNVLRRMLKHAPIVFLPKETKMVACYQVSIGLKESNVIKPHLYEAPTVFGPYFALFEKLGTATKTSYRTYALILEEIHKTLQENEFHVNELRMIRKVVKGFFYKLHLVPDGKDLKDIGADVLYLPSDKHKLRKANELTISDIPNTVSKNAIEGFEFLELDGDCLPDEIKTIVHRLPERHRPRLLSDHIKRTLHHVKLEHQKGTVAEAIQEFINSQEFIDGYIRLIIGRRDAKSAEHKPIDTERVVADLKRIKIIQVGHLQMWYTLKGKRIAEKEFDFLYERESSGEHSEWKCYIKCDQRADITTTVDKIDGKLCECISICTGYILLQKDLLLGKILGAITQPFSISKLLDDNDIKDNSFKRNAVHCHLGQFIERKWHHMLINQLCEFDINEYVAVIANEDDEEANDGNDIYIYAQIKEKIEDGDSRMGFCVRYKVQVDIDDFVIKNAYEVFKFDRQIDNDSSEIVQMVHVDNSASMRQDSSLEEIQREIIRNLNVAWTMPEKERKSVMKRILKTWHPDKNLGQVERATEIFQFIQNMVLILERDGVIEMDDEDSENRTGSMPQPSSSHYDTMFDHVDKQCRRERQHFESNCPNRSHQQSDPEPVPHPGKARKWYRQARNDFTAAKEFLQGIDKSKSYNWICYLCHQAAEKAFSALMYNTDANNVPREHDLTKMSETANIELRVLASKLQSITGFVTAMRYPLYQRIPAESYDRDQAEQAISVCEKILHEICEILTPSI